MKKNIKASTSVRCILLERFCIVCIMHEQETNISRNTLEVTLEVTPAKCKVMYLLKKIEQVCYLDLFCKAIA